MIDQKSRLMKLLAVANRGVGGEAVNARAALEAAMKRQGVTMADLDDDRKEWMFFECKGGESTKRLLVQILRTVCGPVSLYRKTPRSHTLGCEMTKAQASEVDMLWTAHKRQWEKEEEALFIAYIHKQDLFPKADKDADRPEQEPIDQEQLKRIAMLMMGMRTVHARKCLATGGQP